MILLITEPSPRPLPLHIMARCAPVLKDCGVSQGPKCFLPLFPKHPNQKCMTSKPREMQPQDLQPQTKAPSGTPGQAGPGLARCGPAHLGPRTPHLLPQLRASHPHGQQALPRAPMPIASLQLCPGNGGHQHLACPPPKELRFDEGEPVLVSTTPEPAEHQAEHVLM